VVQRVGGDRGEIHAATLPQPPPCAPARLRQLEPRMRLAVRGVPKGALRTHSALQALLWGSLVTCVEYCLRVRQLGLCFFVSMNEV